MDIAARTQDAEMLRQFAPLAEDSARQYEHSLYLGIAHRAWGVLHRLEGHSEPAAGRLAAARDLFIGLNAKWQLGRTLLCIGELALETGDPAEAEATVEEAADLFEAIRAVRELQSAKDSLQRIRNKKH